MATEPHRWAVAMPIEVIVQKNEDGMFACKLPDSVQIHSEGDVFPFDLKDVHCMQCGQAVTDGFGQVCDA